MSVDPRFFRIVDGIKAVDLATCLGATISGGDTDHIITGVAPLAVAGKGEVTYQSVGPLADCAPKAGAIIITTADIAANLQKLPSLRVSKRS